MQQRAVAAECDDAVDLTPAHRSAICDLIEKGELEEVTIGTGWTESYVRELPWSSDAVDDEKTHTKRGVHLALIAALCRHSEAMRTSGSGICVAHVVGRKCSRRAPRDV